MFVAGREGIGPVVISPLLPKVPRGKPPVSQTLCSGMWSVLYSPVGAAQSPVYVGIHQLGLMGGREAGCCLIGMSIFYWQLKGLRTYLGGWLDDSARGEHIDNRMSG